MRLPLGTVIVEFRRGVSARRHLVHETPARALVNLVAKNNRRYGGYIIHLGVVFAFVGIVASSFFRTEVKRSVRQGESFSIGAYDITYVGLKGVEKESLRVTPRGLIAKSPHPRALGSALTNEHITTDYSEALIELVTPAFPETWELTQYLCDLHQFVYLNLPDDELLWATSMPCAIKGDESIPIAQFG